MKKLLPLILSSSLFASSLSYQDFQKEYVQGFNEYQKNLDKEFKEYVETLNKEFENYKKELSKYWQNPELTTKKRFVEYSKDKKVRKKVDFEKKYIQIDVISKDKKEAKKKIAKALAKLSIETTNEAFNNNPVLSKVEKKLKKIGVSAKPDNKPILTNVLFKKPPKSIQEIVTFAKKEVSKRKITSSKSKIKGEYKYTIKIPLPPNTYLKKAKEYKSDVFKRAKKFSLSPSLIFAVIETESSYNPLARSYVPAFGLMQIVPKTAGADAYKMLYGYPRILTPGYLYNEKNNILIGSAYLKRLYYDYFKGVKNPLSRLYLTIAAYNTGPGNVACAFNSNQKDYKGRTICKRSRGDYSVKKALAKINSLSPSQIYHKLINDLRYEEAQNYLKKVSSRMLKYKKAIETNAL